MVLPLFALTVFSGSFLLFIVEPMTAKMLLPLLGGAPTVWNTCVLFFQVMLLAGYALAHGGILYLGTGRYSVVHVAIAIAAAATLPIGISLDLAAAATASPILWILRVLTFSVGLPFLSLAATGPLLQWWFSQTRHASARDPYFLYAASNLGSLFALIAYPALVEPTLRMGEQARLWRHAYLIFASLTVCCAVIAWLQRRTGPPGGAAPITYAVRTRIPWRRCASWIALAFVPSSLLLGVTSYLSTDIAAMPLLWILPLSLYLLSFVAVFGSQGAKWRDVADRRLPVVVLPLAVFMILNIGGPLWLVLPLHLLAFTSAAILCHGALAEDRPEPESLTEFYLWIAVGGVLGGMFNTLLAPVIFDQIVEYPLVLVLACLFRRGDKRKSTVSSTSSSMFVGDVVYSAGLFSLAMVLALGLKEFGAAGRVTMVIPAALSLAQLKLPVRFGLSLAGMFLAGGLLSTVFAEGRIIETRRTFFGVYRVATDPAGRYRQLYHGNILHGMQVIAGGDVPEPLTYYHRKGPFGELIEELPTGLRQSVAVIGLGVGSLAAYVREKESWTFYEIDPAVEQIARNPEHFTYLRACADRCRVILGDARVGLTAAPQHTYGLVVLDAFSSDAIPAHLMTVEAVSLYLSRLVPHGVLAFHISNRHLNLAPVLGMLAGAHQLVMLERVDGGGHAGKMPSRWVVMTRDPRSLGSLMKNSSWNGVTIPASAPLWTDDFTNILSVLVLQ
jgi:hypothetical protein